VKPFGRPEPVATWLGRSREGAFREGIRRVHRCLPRPHQRIDVGVFRGNRQVGQPGCFRGPAVSSVGCFVARLLSGSDASRTGGTNRGREPERSASRAIGMSGVRFAESGS
jgi:hypothetical protein